MPLSLLMHLPWLPLTLDLQYALMLWLLSVVLMLTLDLPYAMLWLWLLLLLVADAVAGRHYRLQSSGPLDFHAHMKSHT